MRGDLPAHSLQCLVGGKSSLLASGSIETRLKNKKQAQTSMLLSLAFAETSITSEPIFARVRKVPGVEKGAEHYLPS